MTSTEEIRREMRLEHVAQLEAEKASLQIQLDRATGIIDEQRRVIERLAHPKPAVKKADPNQTELVLITFNGRKS